MAAASICQRYWKMGKCIYYIWRARNTRKLDTTYASWRSWQTLPRGKPRDIEYQIACPRRVYSVARVARENGAGNKILCLKGVGTRSRAQRKSPLSWPNVIGNRCIKSTTVSAPSATQGWAIPRYCISLSLYNGVILLASIRGYKGRWNSGFID